MSDEIDSVLRVLRDRIGGDHGDAVAVALIDGLIQRAAGEREGPSDAARYNMDQLRQGLNYWKWRAEKAEAPAWPCEECGGMRTQDGCPACGEDSECWEAANKERLRHQKRAVAAEVKLRRISEGISEVLLGDSGIDAEEAAVEIVEDYREANRRASEYKAKLERLTPEAVADKIEEIGVRDFGSTGNWKQDQMVKRAIRELLGDDGDDPGVEWYRLEPTGSDDSSEPTHDKVVFARPRYFPCGARSVDVQWPSHGKGRGYCVLFGDDNLTIENPQYEIPAAEARGRLGDEAFVRAHGLGPVKRENGFDILCNGYGVRPCGKWGPDLGDGVWKYGIYGAAADAIERQGVPVREEKGEQ